jgi:cold shock protein
MPTGRVKIFFDKKGFGFVEPDDGTADLFLHISNVTSCGDVLREGQRVAYSERAGKRPGQREAFGVTLL